MDELPDLKSDADVDALMSRIRGAVAPRPPLASPPRTTPAPSATALGEYLAAQQEMTSRLLHALQLLTDVFEDTLDARERAQPQETRRPRRPRAIKRSSGGVARRRR
jgi:hypothetical protein